MDLLAAEPTLERRSKKLSRRPASSSSTRMVEGQAFALRSRLKGAEIADRKVSQFLQKCIWRRWPKIPFIDQESEGSGLSDRAGQLGPLGELSPEAHVGRRPGVE
jgi:hypothetical protein